MKKILLFFIALYSLCGTLTFADNTLTGLIPGQIWYSKDPLVEGDTIKVYTAIWNSDKDPVSVSVNFYDGSVILGTKDAIIPAESVKDVSVFWKVTKGDHLIYAKIMSSSITSGGKKRPIALYRSSTEEDSRFVVASVKTKEGEVVPSTDIAKNEIDKAFSSLPKSIGEPLSAIFDSVESFRDGAHTDVENSVDENQKIINTPTSLASTDITDDKSIEKALNDNSLVKKELKDTVTKKSPFEAPIPYLKVFLFTSLGMILGNKLVFYGLSLFILFFILRAIIRRIRNK